MQICCVEFLHAAHAQIVDLRARIEADQRLLIQFAEEKVQLAVAGHDLLDMHLSQVTADIDVFDAEMQVRCLWKCPHP